MNRAALAVIAALSFPAAAQAHEEARRPLHPPPPPVAFSERREVAELRELVARQDEVARRRHGRRELAWIEDELLRACDREIAEARAARAVSWQGGPAGWRYEGASHDRPAWARLEALLSVRSGLAGLRGRTDWRAIERKHDLGVELVHLAQLQARYGVPLPPPPPAFASGGHGFGNGWDRGRD